MGIIILFWIVGTPLIYYWATVWKRSKILFSVISIIFTPLIAGLILLTLGHRKGIGKCPKCRKWRKITDTKCVHCEHESTDEESDHLVNVDKRRSSIRKVRLVVLAIFLLIPFWTIYEITQSFFPPIDEIMSKGIQSGIGFETIRYGKIESGDYIATVKISNHTNKTLSKVIVNCRLRGGYKKWNYFLSTKDVLEYNSIGLRPNSSIEYTFIFPFEKYTFLGGYIATYSVEEVK